MALPMEAMRELARLQGEALKATADLSPGRLLPTDATKLRASTSWPMRYRRPSGYITWRAVSSCGESLRRRTSTSRSGCATAQMAGSSQGWRCMCC